MQIFNNISQCFRQNELHYWCKIAKLSQGTNRNRNIRHEEYQLGSCHITLLLRNSTFSLFHVFHSSFKKIDRADYET